MVDQLAASGTLKNRGVLVLTIRRNQRRDRPADNLARSIAEQSLRPAIPTRYHSIQVFTHDGIVRPQMAGGSASALSLSRPAQASLALRPIESLGRPRRPSSRGSDPASYPTKPLASFRTIDNYPGGTLLH